MVLRAQMRYGVGVVCMVGHTSVALIRWEIAMHAFVDGYFSLVTALRVSNHSRTETISRLFLPAEEVYTAPSNLRGGLGMENPNISGSMAEHHGMQGGFYR